MVSLQGEDQQARDKEFCLYGRWKWAAAAGSATAWWPQRGRTEKPEAGPSPGILSCPETKWQHLHSWSFSPTRRPSRQAQKEKRTAGPGLCAVQARDETQGVRGQSLSRRQAAQGTAGCCTPRVRSSSASSPLSPYAGPHICRSLLEARRSRHFTKAQETLPLPHPHPPRVSSPSSAFLKQLHFSYFLFSLARESTRGQEKNQVTLTKQLTWHP